MTAAGNLYIADSGRNQVFEATLGGALLVVAGTGVQGYAGDGGAATAAQLNGPGGVAAGPDGTIYIADTGNARIRSVANGVISTLAGTGRQGFSGDGGVPGAASFRAPGALALDGNGGLLVCDTPDHRVRRLGLGAGGQASTFAGTGVQGYAGDGGAATAAELDSPEGLVVAGDGRVFIADTHNRRVRAVSSAGLIGTFAGAGTQGSGGDGGPAVSAQLAEPRGLAMGKDGTLWIADAGNRRLRQVSPGGIISALAGIGTEGTAVDGATVSGAAFRTPRSIAVSTFGFLAVADTLNGSVRLLTDGDTLFQPAALASGRAGSGVEAVVLSTQVYGQLRASVRVTGPVGTPRGAVTLSEAGSPLASASLAGGNASLAIPIVPAGKHALMATFGGDGLNPEAAGVPFAVTVQPLAITAVANGASAVYGAAPPQITGTLQGVLGTDTGQVEAVFAAAAGPLAAVGTYPISATLSGSKSGNYVVSLAANSGSLHITPAGSVTSLAALAPGYAGVPLRLNAHVDSSTAGQPSGTVQFFDGGTLVATGILVNGSASGIVAAPPAGIHNLSAVYSGDGNFAASSSAAAVASVDVLPDFTIALDGGNSAGTSAGTSAPVAPGSSATYGLLVSGLPVSGLPVSGTAAPFTGVVTLSVKGLPLGATAVFSPTQVVPGSGSAKVTLTVQTPASLARLPIDGRTGIWIACLGLTCLARYRRRFRLGATLSLVGFSFVLAGCGARTVGEGTGGATPRSYPLEITGTSTNLLGAVVTHSTTITLIVGQ